MVRARSHRTSRGGIGRNVIVEDGPGFESRQSRPAHRLPAAAGGPVARQTIRLAHEPTQCRVDVARLGQPKVEPEAERSERLGLAKSRVPYPSPEPKPGIEVSGPHHRTGEPHAGLEDDARLLRVDRHRTTRARERGPGAVGWIDGRRPPAEVGPDRHPDTGVPEIAGDEAVPALGAGPEGATGRGGQHVYGLGRMLLDSADRPKPNIRSRMKPADHSAKRVPTPAATRWYRLPMMRPSRGFPRHPNRDGSSERSTSRCRPSSFVSGDHDAS